MACPLQGIGCFAGPNVDFIIEGNAILSGQWHGIALYHAKNDRVADNAIYSLWMKTSKMKPWIQIKTEPETDEGSTEATTAVNNRAVNFHFDKAVKAEKNELITPEAFKAFLEKSLATIYEKFGETHPLSGRKRLEKIEIQ